MLSEDFVILMCSTFAVGCHASFLGNNSFTVDCGHPFACCTLFSAHFLNRSCCQKQLQLSWHQKMVQGKSSCKSWWLRISNLVYLNKTLDFQWCRNHGIFRLTTPGGMTVIRQCPRRGFHAHDPPSDGSPIYKQCTDVYMNPKLKFDIIDLRWLSLYGCIEDLQMHCTIHNTIYGFWLCCLIYHNTQFRVKKSRLPSWQLCSDEFGIL